MILHHHVATAIQDWTKNPHNDKIWIFNSIYKGWEEVPQENIGKLFLIATEEDYSFICAGVKPVELKCVNGNYFIPGISIEKFKAMIEMNDAKYFYCPSLASKDNYASFRLKNGDNKKHMEYLCQKGFLYDNRNDAVAAVKALLAEASAG
jgi:hypothetical protein